MKNLISKKSIYLTCCFLFFIETSIAQNGLKGKDSTQNISALSSDTAKKTKSKKNPEDGIDDNIILRNKQLKSSLLDPVSKTVPITRLLEARKIRDLMFTRASSKALVKGSNSPSISNLNWTERGPNNVGGRTRALLFDLNDKVNGYKKVFAGGVDGGLWYTNDITATTVSWNRINDFFANIAISCITQDPINPLNIYVGTGEGWENGDAVQGLGVWKTADGGKTWNQLSSTSNFNYINSILVDKNENVYIAGNGIGVQKSKDGGSTWIQVLGFANGLPSNNGADLQLASNGDIYASLGIIFDTGGQVLISDYGKNASNTGDAGTWTNITPDATGLSYDNKWWRIKLACAPNSPNITYALFEGSYYYGATSFQQYNKTTNSWTIKKVPSEAFANGQAWYSMALVVDPNNANVLYSGSLDAESSIDGGTTWNQVSQWYVGELYTLNANQYVHADHHAYAFAPGSSSTLIMGTDGGIFYSNNSNAATNALPTFIDRNNGYNVTQFYSVALHPFDYNYALAGAQDNGSQQFTTTGVNATNEVTGGDGAFTHIDQINPNIQITSYVYNNYFISTDNGKSFNTYFLSDYGQFINPSDYDSKIQNIYAADNLGQYFRWRNVTNNLLAEEITVTNFNYHKISAVTVSPSVGGRVYFGLDNGSVVRVDNADKVQDKTDGVILKPGGIYYNNEFVSSIAVDPSNENHLLVSYSNYGVTKLLETKDASANPVVWSQVQGNLPDIPVWWAMFYPDFPGKAIIATELGVWTTDSLNDVNTIWQPSNSGLANVSVHMLKYRAADRTLAAATHGRGLFTTTLSAFGKLQQTVSLEGKGLVTYGDADFNLQASSTNNTIPIKLISSNPAVATITPTGSIHIKGGGTTLITATQSGDEHYQIGIPAYKTLTVLPAILDITAENKIKFVGNANPPFTATYSGFKNGDTIDSLTTLPILSTVAVDQSPIGKYQIIPYGATSNNYVFNYNPGILSVIPIEGSPTITLVNPDGGTSGGTVNITGTNLSTTTAVSFGGVPATSFVVNSPTSITALIGNGASGDVLVTTFNGTAKYIGFNYLFALPNNNFKVSMASVVCNGGNDGKITITAAKPLNYTVTLVGNNLNTPYNFTDSLTISNLSTGTYSLCVTLASQPSYQQCFTVVLTQPKALSVYTNLNTTTNTLQLLLGGAAKYQIKLNGETYTTTQSTFELPLKTTGINELVVSTDLACQGVFSKVINLTGNNAPYPQPFESMININIGTNVTAIAAFEVFDIIDGKKVYSTTLSNQSGVIQLDLSSLEPGIYSLKMILDNFEKTYKIIKK
jgi:photosystem II stability/assembly factor-like uncharacterized protein